MNVGKFDRLVKIFSPGAPVRTSWGETTDPAPVETEAWAHVKPAPGTERFLNAENAASAVWRFFFRWRDDLVKPTYTIQHDGKIFDVKSVEEVGRRQLLQVLAEARTDG